MVSTEEVRRIIADCKHCKYCSTRNQSKLKTFIDRIFGFDIYARCYNPTTMSFKLGGESMTHAFYCYACRHMCGGCKSVKSRRTT